MNTINRLHPLAYEVLEWKRGDKYLFLGEGFVSAKPERRSGNDRRKAP